MKTLTLAAMAVLRNIFMSVSTDIDIEWVTMDKGQLELD